MTNEEIIEDYYYDDDLDHSYIDAEDFQELMNKARADERAKLAGLYYSSAQVDDMISKAKAKMLKSIVGQLDIDERAKLSKGGVRVNISWAGGIRYEHRDRNCKIDIPMSFANFLGLKEGECKAFEIWECGNV